MSKRVRNYSDEQIREAVATSTMMSEVLRKLGLVPRGGNYEIMWRHIARLGIDAAHLRRSRRGRIDVTWRTPTEDELRRAVAISRSFAGVLRYLDVTVHSRNYARLRTELERYDIDLTHFTGRGWSRGLRFDRGPLRPLHEILRDGVSCSTNTLKKRLIREGVKPARCEMCRLEEWMHQPITLELDHINGDRDDNRLENLRLLCPNCHSVTDNWRGRNIGRARVPRQLRIV